MFPQQFQLLRSFSQDEKSLAGKRLERDTLRRVLRFARPYRSKLIYFVVTIVLLAVVDVVPPLLLRTLIDKAIPEASRSLVVWLAATAAVLAILNAGFSLVQRWLSADIGEGLIFDLRTALFDHVQGMPIAFFTGTQTGALVSRMNNDVIGAQRALTQTLSQIVSNVIGVTATLVAMFALSWQVTAIALLVLPVFVFTSRRIAKRMQVLTREAFNLDASMNTMMNERFNVAGALLVKLFGRSRNELGEFASRAGRVRDIGVVTAVYNRAFLLGFGLVASLVTAGLYLIGGMGAVDGTFEVGTIVALSLYLAQLYPPLTALTTTRIDFLTAMVSFERVFEVLDLEQAVADKPGAKELVEPRGAISFDHVSFEYPPAAQSALASLADGLQLAEGSKQVLHDVDFDVSPGEFVAIVGPSGAGKTTMVSLVPRLYDTTTGTVRIDGLDVRDVSLESLRSAIGVVSQDPHLFHTSIAENLRFARPDATDDDLRLACSRAQILELVESLPEGFETVVGERGYRLSGGEKQRLAIARVLLKDPAVVVLDEATSHLDTENERLVQHALDEALADRTSLVIAHRLSTVVAADRIIVVDRGRIAQSGTHRELLAGGGLYAELHARQFADTSADA